MVDILLAHSNFMHLDAKQRQKVKPYPPLGTLFAAALLRAHGYRVALFDAMLADGEHDFATALAHHQPRYVALFEDNFNFLSKMCLSRMRQAAQTMARMAEAQHAVVIAAGADVTDRPELYLGHGAAYALAGEGDWSLLELVQHLDAGSTELDGIAGLVRLRGGGLHRNEARPPERHPDVFPMPAWDLVDVARYREVWRDAHGFFSLNMASTRGCPFHCNWCAKPIWGQRYAMRSPANVAEELAWVKRELQPDTIWFADDIFGLRPQWVAEFAQEVEARDAAIPFTIQTRVDLMTPAAVAGLRRAGCREAWLGAESGSQAILDAMDKGTRLEEIKVARERLREAGIRACFFLQFGYPGEGLAEIQATVAMVRDCLPDDIGVSVSYPLPGTRFHERIALQLHEQTNWVDSDELAMLFRGAYGTEFYRLLHRTIHCDLRVHQQLAAGGLSPAELTELTSLWLELGRLEPAQRNPDATVLEAVAPLAPPDLTHSHN